MIILWIVNDYGLFDVWYTTTLLLNGILNDHPCWVSQFLVKAMESLEIR